MFFFFCVPFFVVRDTLLHLSNLLPHVCFITVNESSSENHSDLMSKTNRCVCVCIRYVCESPFTINPSSVTLISSHFIPFSNWFNSFSLNNLMLKTLLSDCFGSKIWVDNDDWWFDDVDHICSSAHTYEKQEHGVCDILDIKHILIYQ